MISGIYQPDEGRVFIDGLIAGCPRSGWPRPGVARTFQNLALFKGLSVLDNIATARVAFRRAGLARAAYRCGTRPARAGGCLPARGGDH
ncbi:MAG: hypothetical protein QM796_01600 [Chthoniobacteraceae bacterium]